MLTGRLRDCLQVRWWRSQPVGTGVFELNESRALRSPSPTLQLTSPRLSSPPRPAAFVPTIAPPPAAESALDRIFEMLVRRPRPLAPAADTTQSLTVVRVAMRAGGQEASDGGPLPLARHRC